MNSITFAIFAIFVLLFAALYFEAKKARAVKAATATGGKVYRVVGRVAKDLYGDTLFLRDELFGQVIGYEYGEYIIHVREDMVWLADMYVHEGILTEA